MGVSLGFLSFYLTGGVLAAWPGRDRPESPIPTIGASGRSPRRSARYWSSNPGARVTSLVFARVLLPALGSRPAIVLVLWFGLQLIDGIGSLGATQSGGVAFFAHIGGFVSGRSWLDPPDALGGGRQRHRWAWDNPAWTTELVEMTVESVRSICYRVATS